MIVGHYDQCVGSFSVIKINQNSWFTIRNLYLIIYSIINALVVINQILLFGKILNNHIKSIRRSRRKLNSSLVTNHGHFYFSKSVFDCIFDAIDMAYDGYNTNLDNLYTSLQNTQLAKALSSNYVSHLSVEDLEYIEHNLSFRARLEFINNNAVFVKSHTSNQVFVYILFTLTGNLLYALFKII